MVQSMPFNHTHLTCLTPLWGLELPADTVTVYIQHTYQDSVLKHNRVVGVPTDKPKSSFTFYATVQSYTAITSL
jgi:hypothetical protein